jgi:hypothetical protein
VRSPSRSPSWVCWDPVGASDAVPAPAGQAPAATPAPGLLVRRRGRPVVSPSVSPSLTAARCSEAPRVLVMGGGRAAAAAATAATTTTTGPRRHCLRSVRADSHRPLLAAGSGEW